MDILFCDLCNESVPQSDLDLGRAYLRRGRVICASCERAMTHAEGAEPHAAAAAPGTFAADVEVAPGPGGAAIAGTESAPPPGLVASGPAEVASPSIQVASSSVQVSSGPGQVAPGSAQVAFGPAQFPVGSSQVAVAPGQVASAPASPLPEAAGTAPASTRSSGLVLAMVALIFAAGAVAVLNEQVRALRERGQAVETRLRTQTLELSALEREGALARGALATLEGQMGEQLAVERERAEEALTQLRSEAERLQREQRDLTGSLDEVREGTLETGQDAARRSEELTERLAKSEAESRALLERIAKLEEQAQSPPPLPTAAESGPVPISRWGALVNDLQSPKAATRWEAVDQIGQTGDPQAVPYLVPMLRDTDVFVRMATARVLGDLRATSAVPVLIDALEDGEAAVREAALGALRGITGRDLRFDPLAGEADRAKKVKAWREWWKKEGEAEVGKGQE